MSEKRVRVEIFEEDDAPPRIMEIPIEENETVHTIQTKVGAPSDHAVYVSIKNDYGVMLEDIIREGKGEVLYLFKNDDGSIRERGRYKVKKICDYHE